MSGTGSVVLGLSLALIVATPAAGQGGLESKPAVAGESRPKQRGSGDLLRSVLAEHAELRRAATKDALAKAEAIDRKLLEYDWSALDVPAITYEFALDQERKSWGKQVASWDFDRLPPSLARIATSEKWASFVERHLDALIDQAGSVSWRSPKARGNAASDMMRSRAFEKVASHLATHLAASVASIPRADLTRMHDAFFRIYEDYDLETVQRSSQYGYLPAGYYLQWAAWLGDRRAWRVATLMIEAWCSYPRDAREPNLVQAVRVIDLFNTRLDPAREPERAQQLARIKADPRIPQSVKAYLRPPGP